MEDMKNAFQQYLNENPDIDEVLNTYDEIETVYRELLQSMGWMKQGQPIAEDSTKVTISVPNAYVYNSVEPGEMKEKASYSTNS